MFIKKTHLHNPHSFFQLPPEYPFKPPHILFLTPSGRFETNTKVCLSFSAFHPELWQPAWGIRLILEALISFLPTPADGAIGALDWSKDERKRLAKMSQSYCCPTCGSCMKLLPKLDHEAKKKVGTRFAKEIAELQRLQQESEKKKLDGTPAGTTNETGTKRNEDESSAEESHGGIVESLSQDAPEEEIVFEEDSDEKAPPACAQQTTPTGEEVQAENPNPATVAEDNPIPDVDEMEAAVPMDDPSWMYDPLLNFMLILMAAICYLLIQKYQELMDELRELRQLSSDLA